MFVVFCGVLCLIFELFQFRFVLLDILQLLIEETGNCDNCLGIDATEERQDI